MSGTHHDNATVVADGENGPVRGENPYPATSPAGAVSVGDFVWIDTDRDGVQDAGEPGIPGVSLSITRSDGEPALNADGSTPVDQTTDANGGYSFTGLEVLPAGVHYVVTLDASTVPAGLVPTVEGAGNDSALDSSTGSEESTDLTTDGASDMTLDFGFVRGEVSVGDYVWIDSDRDGVQDSGEPGIPGVSLSITRSDGEPALNADGSTPVDETTDANGGYSFTGLETLPAGVHYVVTLDPTTVPSVYEPTIANTGTDAAVDSSTGSEESTDLTTDGASDMTLDFGFVKKQKPVIVQVDRYGWGTTVGKKPSALYGNKIANFDNDGILKFGEDFWVGAKWKPAFPFTTKAVKLVTVTVDVDAKQQLLDAVNVEIAGSGFGPLTTTAKLGKVTANGVVTDAWILGKGATLTAPFGPGKNISQTYLGRG